MCIDVSRNVGFEYCEKSCDESSPGVFNRLFNVQGARAYDFRTVGPSVIECSCVCHWIWIFHARARAYGNQMFPKTISNYFIKTNFRETQNRNFRSLPWNFVVVEYYYPMGNAHLRLTNQSEIWNKGLDVSAIIRNKECLMIPVGAPMLLLIVAHNGDDEDIWVWRTRKTYDIDQCKHNSRRNKAIYWVIEFGSKKAIYWVIEFSSI